MTNNGTWGGCPFTLITFTDDRAGALGSGLPRAAQLEGPGVGLEHRSALKAQVFKQELQSYPGRCGKESHPGMRQVSLLRRGMF